MGNFIIYPDNISQGWDASLAHLPYWNLRKNALIYMDNNQIPIPETASFFPNYTTIDNVDVNGDMRSFIHFTGTEKYVFYSNVYNLRYEEYFSLHNNYELLKSFRKHRIKIDLFKLKEH